MRHIIALMLVLFSASALSTETFVVERFGLGFAPRVPRTIEVQCSGKSFVFGEDDFREPSVWIIVPVRNDPVVIRQLVFVPDENVVSGVGLRYIDSSELSALNDEMFHLFESASPCPGL